MLMQSWLYGVQSLLKRHRRMRRAPRRRRPVAPVRGAEVFEVRSYPAATLTATLTAGVLNIDGTTKADTITVQQTRLSLP